MNAESQTPSMGRLFRIEHLAADARIYNSAHDVHLTSRPVSTERSDV